ncbi:hypothetical protein M501DRAFT_1004026, partial [Patellaria atrata CBS 101060]
MANTQVVLYNPAITAAAHANRNPVLLVTQQQLAPWCHSPQNRALLAVGGGVDVEFVRDSITPSRLDLIGSHMSMGFLSSLVEVTLILVRLVVREISVPSLVVTALRDTLAEHAPTANGATIQHAVPYELVVQISLLKEPGCLDLVQGLTELTAPPLGMLLCWMTMRGYSPKCY